MPQLERFLNIWKFIYSYVQDIESSVSSTFCAICDSLKLCKVHYFGKRWFFLKYFKLVHAPTWKILHYMIGFLSICTRHKAFGFFDWFALSATLLCLVPSIFWKKMIFFFMKYFKLVHAPTWKIPQYMNCFLFICTRHRVRYMLQLERFLNMWKFFYSFVQDIESSVSSTFMRYLRLPTALQGTLFWKKMIFHEIFQVAACPNLKDSFLYKYFSIHLNKT